MAVNDNVNNKAVKRSIDIEGYKKNLINKVLKLLNQSDNRLREQINSISGETWTKARLNRVLSWIKSTDEKLLKQIDDLLKSEYIVFIEDEIDFNEQMIFTSLPSEIRNTGIIQFDTPSPQTVFNLALSRPFQTKKFKEWFSDWNKQHTQIIDNNVRLAMIEGKTIQQTTREIFGTIANQFRDGAIEVSRRIIQTIVRTTTNHISNTTRNKVFENNEDIVKGVEWVSTLDSRTSLICINLDGKIDLYDGSKKQLNGQIPPAHPNCRSTIIPILKSWQELGLDREELSESTRASANGQVSSKMSYSEWLGKQSTKTQKEVLGVKRYEAWKKGEIKISNFTDNKNNILTIDQLKQKGFEINGNTED